MSNKIKWSIGLVAVVVLAYVLLPDNGTSGDTQQRQIETTQLDVGNIVRAVATSGAVRPLITVEVGSQLSGQLADIYVDFNSEVKAGDIIALIDSKTFESRVVQSSADLKVARSNVIVQRAAIDRAKANLRKARLEYERAEPLANAGTLSASDFDTALASFESAKADLTMAEAQLQNALANEEQRQASLESAEIDLERTKIRSPIDGVVIERAVDQGQTVAASFSAPVLFRIAQDLTKIQIEANVDEADIGNVVEGNEASFTVDAYPDLEFTGRVEQVRLAPNETNNVVTYTVIITADNPDLKLLPGMTAIVEIITGKAENVLRVSNDAVRFRPPPDSELARKVSLTRPPKGEGQRGGHPAKAGQPEQGKNKKSAEGRRGLLWIQTDDGINPVPVLLGISDDQNTQVLGKKLSVDDVAVTRIRTARK
ncbi:MAG: efflux RND transporter periplasmic adaptor subunit [Xanthomonadales bacterium]|nr:efflux RND transporter periplasmic adaptor subunit [Xanthomonadales bacterium]